MSKEEFVSTFGLLRCCNHSSACGGHKKYKAKDVLYVKLEELSEEFFDELEEQKQAVILLSNDSDMDGPFSPEMKRAELFLNSENCIAWFCQNQVYYRKHPKVIPIPIGVQFRSMDTVKQENAELWVQKKQGKPFWKRKIRCVQTFEASVSGKKYGKDRVECVKEISKSLMDYPGVLERSEYWKKIQEYAFVPSPAGNGYDCYRTYEVLVLGSIPIVKRRGLPYERLFDELPVLLVDSWKDVMEEKLLKTVKEFQHRSFRMELLTLKFWEELVQSKKDHMKALTIKLKCTSRLNTKS